MAAPASLTELLVRLFLTGCWHRTRTFLSLSFNSGTTKEKHFRVLAVKSGNLLLRKPKSLS